jgi:hypothetical protein
VPGAISEIRPSTGTIEPLLERNTTKISQHDFVAELTERISAAPSELLVE